MEEPVPAKKSDLLPRILSALVLIPMAIAAVYYGGVFWYGVLCVFAIALAWEWTGMIVREDGGQGFGFHFAICVLTVLAALVLAYFLGTTPAFMLCIGIALIFMSIGALKLNGPNFWNGFGILYFATPLLALFWLRALEQPSGALLILFLFLMVWGSDIGAYIFGRIVGGPKIFPSISPKKTWAGAIGGILCSAGLAAAMKASFDLAGSYAALAIAGMLLSVVTQLGDAIESAFKRHFDVKDSGKLIPGHGGALDRVDGLLFAAPVMAAFIGLGTQI